jgi:NTE family protein
VTTDFSVTPQDGGWALRLVGHSKPWGPNYLRFGAAIFTDLEGESQFDTQVAYTMTRLNRNGAELKTAVQVGQNPIGQAEFYQPLARSRVPFLAASIYGGQIKTQIPVHTATEQYRFWVQRAAFDLGISLGRYGELRAGVRRDDTRGRATRVDANQLPKFDHSDGGMRVALTIDQLDSINFPRRGFLGYAEHYQAHNSLGGDVAYRRLELSLVAAATHRRHTLIALAHGGSALGGTLPTGQRLQLGGLFSLSGLPRGEVSGSYGGVAGLIYLFRLGRLPNFGEGIYAGVSLETGNLWETREQVSSKRLRHSFAAVFAADTILGPVYVAHGTTSGGKDSFYLLLGRTF